MPPSTETQPTEAERKEISGWVGAQLDNYYAQHPNPGRITLHRLNRVEYDNTIKDLVGIDLRAADEFPADDSGYGFDNIADVLSLPPMLMEKYMAAADKLMDQAIVTDPITSKITRIPATLTETSFYGYGDRGDGWVQLNSGMEDFSAITLLVPATGEYIIRTQAFAQRTGDPGLSLAVKKGILGDGPLTASIQVDDTVIRNIAVTEDQAHPQVYEARVALTAGKRRVGLVMHHDRGGDNEDIRSNNLIGRDQPGNILIRYLETEGPLAGSARIYSPAQLKHPETGHPTPTGGWVLTDQGNVSVPFAVVIASNVVLRATACATRSGNEPAKMQFSVDGAPVAAFDVWAPDQTQPQPKNGQDGSPLSRIAVPRMYDATVKLSPGKHELAAGFMNPAADPGNANPNLRQRTLTIERMQIVNPTGLSTPPPMPAVLAQIFEAHGVKEGDEDNPAPTSQFSDVSSPQATDAARQIINDFAFRAWRRPVPTRELDRLMRLYDLAAEQGQSFEGCTKLAMKAVLVSPHFLFRETMSKEDTSVAGVHLIDEYALASRLSYFLWSTTPDPELMDLARKGHLRDHLDEQITRMLASPRAEQLVQNFGGQWLQFRTLDGMQPAKTFTKFDAALRAAIKKEPELLFDYVMRQDRSIVDFLDADYAFVNERLADFYGIQGVTGEEFQKVSLEGIPRRGVLTEASTLLLTSNPTRTSPVKRGKWVLDRLLGAPPPPPLPNLPGLDDPERQLKGTLRQKMEQHRTDPNCISCHSMMDPIGFSLENYDAIGEYRLTDGEGQIDASGTLVSGESFVGAMQLVKILAARRDDFLNCFAEQMLTYALGRGVEYYDRGAVDGIVANMKANDDRFSSVIRGIVMSVPFQMEQNAPIK